ncbi:flagellar brake protein [Vibrio sp. T187]|uniref:flagellar brake protein n=1 Tax=Vibrio TaxID=662 RepID=UPI0010C9E724|nr:MULTISPECIES: flagellar brake protein [Vibrio]MBW3695100.1 flagellar brake protein [Vibrio sp. T187]
MNLPMKKLVKNNTALQESRNQTVSTLNSTDALAMVEHGSELTLNVTTPVGTKFLATTRFIGSHSNNCILVEVPQVSVDDLAYFFQEGFIMTVRALSHRGEGALIHFRSQIQHKLSEPFPLLVISIPSTMQVTQLRKEIRYEVNLGGKVLVNSRRTECEVRDISKSGCRFVTSPTTRPIQVGDQITIEIVPESQRTPLIAPLHGIVCNLQKSTHYARYGVEFDQLGKASAKSLLGKLKFDGTKLRFRH